MKVLQIISQDLWRTVICCVVHCSRSVLPKCSQRLTDRLWTQLRFSYSSDFENRHFCSGASESNLSTRPILLNLFFGQLLRRCTYSSAINNYQITPSENYGRLSCHNLFLSTPEIRIHTAKSIIAEGVVQHSNLDAVTLNPMTAI